MVQRAHNQDMRARRTMVRTERDTMTTTLTPRERELARHALGLDGRRKRSYRNYYVIDAGDDHEAWLGLTERGLAKRHKGNPLTGGSDWFWLTRTGALAALEPGETLDDEDFPG